MHVATVTDAKNGLSALLARVRAGETILIVDRGIPVARLEPAAHVDESAEGRLARLRRAGLVEVGRGPLPPDALAPPPADGGASGVLAALLDEREHGR